jgi:hypothetical protein
MAIGDLNGDGNLDVIENGGLIDPADQIFPFNVAFGDGKGGLAPWMSYPFVDSFSTGPLALADVKGDGSLSAVFMYNQPQTAYYTAEQALNRGNGVFDVIHQQDSNSNPLVPPPIDVQLKDINGDHKPDLVFLLSPQGANQSSGSSYVLVYVNTGTYPYFQVNDPLLFQLPSGTAPAINFAITDVNNDGLNDILVGTNDSSGAGGYLLLNTSPRKQPGIPVFVEAGAITGGHDFLNVQTPAASAVYGQVFQDDNRNSLQDTGETGPAGRFVFVDLNRDGKYEPGEPSAVTRGNGVFSIPNLPDGTYSVGVLPEDDWRTTTPQFFEVRVDGHTAAEANFGLARRLIADVPGQQAKVNQPVSLTVPVTANAAGHKLVYTLEAGAPEGAGIDPRTGVFTWTPTALHAGQSQVVTVGVHDLYDPAFAETQSFTIQVAESAARAQFVRGLYATVLGRSPEAAGLDYWVGLLNGGATPREVTEAMWESAEHRGLEVDQFYATYLHRSADAFGRAFWVNSLRGGVSEEQVAEGFLTSAEYRQAHAGTDAYLTGLYADVLGRTPDAAGLDYWQAAAQGGLSPAQLADAFLGSPEADERRVDGYYRDYLARSGEAAGVAFWVGALQGGGLTPDQVAQAFLASDEFYNQGSR